MPNTRTSHFPAPPTDAFPLIHAPYVLCCRITLFIDAMGMVHGPLLWAWDLERHFEYIKDFRICCSVVRGETAPEGWQSIPALSANRVIALRRRPGWTKVLHDLLPNFFAVRRAVKQAKIVHSDMAGWPFPLSYYLLILRPFMPFQWIIIMESSFWMKQVGAHASASVWLRHHVHLFLSRACMRRADVRIFTQSWYRDMLLGADRRNTLINEAVWVQEQDVLSDVAFAARIHSGPVKLLYPTRLVAEKGVASVLAAISEAEAVLTNQVDAPHLIVDIIGSGAMESDLRSFIAQHPGRAVTVSFLDPVPYGASFFELVGDYDAIIVANLMEEQPRIIYDAFSQGVPCIASRTSGVTQIVHEEGEMAQLFTPGVVAELAERLVDAARGRTTLIEMGRSALAFARGRTHEAMHRARALYLIETLTLTQ